MSALKPRRLEVTGSDGVRRSLDEHYDCLRDVQQDPCGAHCAIHAQAMRIAELEAENARLREALEWYAEQSRLCRLIHSEGDIGRYALAADAGKRARAALTPKEPEE